MALKAFPNWATIHLFRFVSFTSIGSSPYHTSAAMNSVAQGILAFFCPYSFSHVMISTSSDSNPCFRIISSMKFSQIFSVGINLSVCPIIFGKHYTSAFQTIYGKDQIFFLISYLLHASMYPPVYDQYWDSTM